MEGIRKLAAVAGLVVATGCKPILGRIDFDPNAPRGCGNEACDTGEGLDTGDTGSDTNDTGNDTGDTGQDTGDTGSKPIDPEGCYAQSIGIAADTSLKVKLVLDSSTYDADTKELRFVYDGEWNADESPHPEPVPLLGKYSTNHPDTCIGEWNFISASEFGAGDTGDSGLERATFEAVFSLDLESSSGCQVDVGDGGNFQFSLMVTNDCSGTVDGPIYGQYDASRGEFREYR